MPSFSLESLAHATVASENTVIAAASSHTEGLRNLFVVIILSLSFFV
jgi:hypothetical protein